MKLAKFVVTKFVVANMVTPTILNLIDSYRDWALGWKLSGAGGGGYLVLVADEPIENGIRIVARRAL